MGCGCHQRKVHQILLQKALVPQALMAGSEGLDPDDQCVPTRTQELPGEFLLGLRVEPSFKRLELGESPSTLPDASKLPMTHRGQPLGPSLGIGSANDAPNNLS